MTLILSGTDGVSDIDGSAATPAIRGTDANTGIFFPAADTIAFSEGGAEAMRIDSSGNVGIGTSSPAVKLHTTGTTNELARFNASSTGTGYVLITQNNSTSEGLKLAYTNSDGSSAIGSVYAGALKFLTGDTERARIDSSGRIQMNTTAPKYSATLTIVKGGNSYNITSSVTATSSQGHMVFENNSADAVGSIFTSGSATQYNTSSDYRLKEKIAPMTGALAKVALLKPCTYKWKVDGSDGQGFIAHELDEVVPGCVTGEKDAVGEQQYVVTPAVKDEEGNTITEAVMGTRTVPVYQGIDTSFLVATLTAAIQEQQALITGQQAMLASLTARIEALEQA